MHAAPPDLRRIIKSDRNTHEFSAEESPCHVEPYELQKQGGGHRSSSIGAGTSDKPTTQPDNKRSGPR